MVGEFPWSIWFRMEAETFTSVRVPPRFGGWIRGSRKTSGRSVSRFSARPSVTFPRIKFESIFLSVTLVTPLTIMLAGKPFTRGKQPNHVYQPNQQRGEDGKRETILIATYPTWYLLYYSPLMRETSLPTFRRLRWKGTFIFNVCEQWLYSVDERGCCVALIGPRTWGKTAARES